MFSCAVVSNYTTELISQQALILGTYVYLLQEARESVWSPSL